MPVVAGRRIPGPPNHDQFCDKYWVEAYDSVTGKDYYYHTTTGYSTWEKPWMREALAEQAAAEGGPPPAQLSDCWTRHFFQELVGAFVAQFLGSGVIWSMIKTTFDAMGYPAADVLGMEKMAIFQGGMTMFNQLVCAFGVSLAFAMGIGVALHGQLNPAFTLSMALLGAKKWHHVLASMLGQLVGYFLGCCCFYSMIACYVPHWDSFTGGWIEFKGADLKFISLFTGSNGPGIIADTDGQGGSFTMANVDCFWSSVYLESLMVMLIIPIFASPEKLHRSVEPLIIASVIFIFVLASQSMGACLNPAQYLAGTFFCYCFGWPSTIWTHDDHYIWTAVFAPMVGAILGCFCIKIYYIVIFHHPAYWLEEAQFLFHSIWKGLIPMDWRQMKIKQYVNPASQEPHGRPTNRSRAGSLNSHAGSMIGLRKDDDEPLSTPLNP